MARKITPLKHIYPKDQRAISILAKTGAISKETFNKLQISDNRIKSYRDAGLIKEVSIPNKHGDGFRNFYELTEKHGKDFACKHFFTSWRHLQQVNAVFGASRARLRSASVVLPLLRASRVLPTVIRVRIVAADSK